MLASPPLSSSRRLPLAKASSLSSLMLSVDASVVDARDRARGGGGGISVGAPGHDRSSAPRCEKLLESCVRWTTENVKKRDEKVCCVVRNSANGDLGGG